MRVVFAAGSLFETRAGKRASAATKITKPPRPRAPSGPPPASRLARQLALAYYIERLVEDGTLKDYAEAARLLRISRARMTQVIDLLGLEPAVQERILKGEEAGSERVRRGYR
jgi:hypothetical protein